MQSYEYLKSFTCFVLSIIQFTTLNDLLQLFLSSLLWNKFQSTQILDYSRYIFYFVKDNLRINKQYQTTSFKILLQSINCCLFYFTITSQSRPSTVLSWCDCYKIFFQKHFFFQKFPLFLFSLTLTLTLKK